MKHSFLDQYSDGDSLIHKLDPRTKLITTLVFILAVTLTPPTRWQVFAVYFFSVAALVLLSKVPVIFVCENNYFASFSKVSARQAIDNIPGRAEAFGVPGKRVNGMDVIEIYNASQEAVDRAKKGNGPTLIEAVTYRFKGHCGVDNDIDPKLRTEEEKALLIMRSMLHIMRMKMILL